MKTKTRMRVLVVECDNARPRVVARDHWAEGWVDSFWRIPVAAEGFREFTNLRQARRWLRVHGAEEVK